MRKPPPERATVEEVAAQVLPASLNRSLDRVTMKLVVSVQIDKEMPVKAFLALMIGAASAVSGALGFYLQRFG